MQAVENSSATSITPTTSDTTDSTHQHHRSLLTFDRFVLMYENNQFTYRPPFLDNNPIRIDDTTKKAQDNYETNLLEILLYESVLEPADVGLKSEKNQFSDEIIEKDEEEEEEKEEEEIFYIREDSKKIVKDAYALEPTGKLFIQDDTEAGMIPNKNFFRLGNGTPLGTEDIPHFEEMDEEKRDIEKTRRYRAICSLNVVMHFLYARCKRSALLLERKPEPFSLLSKLYNLYKMISSALKKITPSEVKQDVSAMLYINTAVKTIASSLMLVSKHVKGLTGDADNGIMSSPEITYAFAYNVHRKIFGGICDGFENTVLMYHNKTTSGDGILSPSFSALVGQELWLWVHYMLPSMQRLYKDSVVKMLYNGVVIGSGQEATEVDVFSYTYGEIFIRDLYRFEISTHEAYLKEIRSRMSQLPGIQQKYPKSADDNDTEEDVDSNALVDSFYATILEYSKDPSLDIFSIIDRVENFLGGPSNEEQEEEEKEKEGGDNVNRGDKVALAIWVHNLIDDVRRQEQTNEILSKQ